MTRKKQTKHAGGGGGFKLTRLPLEKAAILLFKDLDKDTALKILQKDIAEGAPANEDGTINLVNYAAWLVRELGANGN